MATLSSPLKIKSKYIIFEIFSYSDCALITTELIYGCNHYFRNILIHNYKLFTSLMIKAVFDVNNIYDLLDLKILKQCLLNIDKPLAKEDLRALLDLKNQIGLSLRI